MKLPVEVFFIIISFCDSLTVINLAKASKILYHAVYEKSQKQSFPSTTRYVLDLYQCLGKTSVWESDYIYRVILNIPQTIYLQKSKSVKVDKTDDIINVYLPTSRTSPETFMELQVLENALEFQCLHSRCGIELRYLHTWSSWSGRYLSIQKVFMTPRIKKKHTVTLDKLKDIVFNIPHQHWGHFFRVHRIEINLGKMKNIFHIK